MGCQYVVDIRFEGAGTILESDKPLDFTNQNRVYLYHKEFDLGAQIGHVPYKTLQIFTLTICVIADTYIRLGFRYRFGRRNFFVSGSGSCVCASLGFLFSVDSEEDSSLNDLMNSSGSISDSYFFAISVRV